MIFFPLFLLPLVDSIDSPFAWVAYVGFYLWWALRCANWAKR